MTGDRPVRRGLRDPVVVCAALAALAAVAVPPSWFTGTPGADDPRMLEAGAWILRGSLLALAAFLFAAQDPRGVETPTPEPLPRGVKVGLLATLCVAAVLRAVRLDAPLWFDEIWSLVDFVRRPLADIVRSYSSDNNHLLYSALGRISISIFGESAWAFRLPAALLGVAGVGMLFVFARPRVGPWNALLASALLALSSHHVWFSQNARGYTGMMLFALASSHFMLDAMRTGRRRSWIGHGACLALCIAFHLTGGFVAVGQLAILCMGWIRREVGRDGAVAVARGLLLGVISTVVLHALVLPQMATFFLASYGYRPGKAVAAAAWTDPWWLVETAARSLGLGLAAGLAAFAVAGGLVLVGLVRTWRRAREIPLLLVVPGVTMAVALVGMGRNLWPRMFFFLGAFGVLVVVEGVLGVTQAVAERLPGGAPDVRRRVALRAVSLLAVVAAALMAPRAFLLPKQDYPAAAAWIAQHRVEGERVVSVGLASVPYTRYYDTDFVAVDSPEQLDELIPPGTAGWVVQSSRVFMESRRPTLWNRVLERGTEAARFRGSMDDGDVVVFRLEGP